MITFCPEDSTLTENVAHVNNSPTVCYIHITTNAPFSGEGSFFDTIRRYFEWFAAAEMNPDLGLME